MEPKRGKLLLDIPEWELECDFDPSLINIRMRSQHEHDWVNYRGETLSTSACQITAEDVVAGSDFGLDNLQFRNPNVFIAGNLHNYPEEWEKINASEEVKNWIHEGVKIDDFFNPFQGNFKGKAYNSSFPPPTEFPNASNCADFVPFIIDTLYERKRNGSLSVVGKVGDCDPPHLILPITIEPNKPRLCHDERFLNLWIKDSPFHLDTLREVPRIIDQHCFMVSLDDKSGYDHIFLHKDSRKYFCTFYFLS